MSAGRKQPVYSLQLGDCVHYKGQGFGRIVKAGRFYVEVLLTTRHRLQTCVRDQCEHRGGITKEFMAAVDALPSKSVARNLENGVVIDHIEHGLGRVIGRTGDTLNVRFLNCKSIMRLALADSTGMIVDLFGRSIGRCRAEISEAQGRKSLIKVVSRSIASPVRSTDPRPKSSKLQDSAATSTTTFQGVRATAAIETNVSTPARQIRIAGASGRGPKRLPPRPEREPAREETRAIKTNVPTPGRPIQTAATTSTGGKRLPPRAQQEPTSAGSPQRTVKMSACSKCGAAFKVEQLKEHLRVAHPRSTAKHQRSKGEHEFSKELHSVITRNTSHKASRRGAGRTSRILQGGLCNGK
jgi:hypothetical protein